MPTLGAPELIIILLIVVVLFGAGRLSEIGGAFGRGVREFRKATRDEPAPGPPAATTVTTTTSAPVTNGTTTVVPTVIAENKCSNCGAVNRAEQTFCGQCGTRLTVAA
jgi:sec-independent protein translocase protein TatA